MAVVIFSIVLAAINTVFYGALRLRNRTTEALDASHSLNHVLDLVRRDLQNIVPPGGMMAPSFKIGPVSSSTRMPQAPGIEFFTTTGAINDAAPWGDIQKVIYQLQEPLDPSRANGKDLVRCVTRNLLATTTEEAVAQRLLSDVEALEFLGCTGSDWRSVWDTTLTDTNLPTAIRVRLLLATEREADSRNRQPIELFIPVAMQVQTNASSTATSGGEQ